MPAEASGSAIDMRSAAWSSSSSSSMASPSLAACLRPILSRRCSSRGPLRTFCSSSSQKSKMSSVVLNLTDLRILQLTPWWSRLSGVRFQKKRFSCTVRYFGSLRMRRVCLKSALRPRVLAFFSSSDSRPSWMPCSRVTVSEVILHCRRRCRSVPRVTGSSSDSMHRISVLMSMPNNASTALRLPSNLNSLPCSTRKLDMTESSSLKNSSASCCAKPPFGVVWANCGKVRRIVCTKRLGVTYSSLRSMSL
mmetsp:Transcript_19305/g.48801  ORF Transcript_19305/g.48801 Transcript_19305/m.48801 type:complete len:250 (-) Transcript_19305:496-1245(-)